MKRLTRYTSISTTSLVLALTMLFLFSGSATPAELPKEIAIGTNPTGSLYHTAGSGLAKIVTEHTPMAGTVKALSGPPAWLPLMYAGDVQFGLMPAHDLMWAWRGGLYYTKTSEAITGKKEGLRALRLTMFGFRFLLGWFVSPEIKSASDIKGKRVPYPVPGHPSYQFGIDWGLANVGVSLDEVKKVPCADLKAVFDAYGEGRIDAFVMPAGIAPMKRLYPVRKYKIVPVDTSAEGLARLKKVNPVIFISYQKAGPLGVTERTPVYSYYVGLITTKDISDDTVSVLVRAVWEHCGELAPMHPALKDWVTEHFVSPLTPVPYHEGAIKVYKEKGVWTNEMESRQRELLKGG